LPASAKLLRLDHGLELFDSHVLRMETITEFSVGPTVLQRWRVTCEYLDNAPPNRYETHTVHGRINEVRGERSWKRE